jgi:hypothetical protein
MVSRLDLVIAGENEGLDEFAKEHNLSESDIATLKAGNKIRYDGYRAEHEKYASGDFDLSNKDIKRILEEKRELESVYLREAIPLIKSWESFQKLQQDYAKFEHYDDLLRRWIINFEMKQ